MKVRKRDGTEEEFNIVKIINAIKKANKATEENKLEPLTDEKFEKVLKTVEKKLEPFSTVSVEDIQDMVEDSLIKHNCYDVAKCYIKYREMKKQNKKFTTNEERILSIVNLKNENVSGDNANKNPRVLPTMRDYIAGTMCKSIARKTLSKDIVNAHDKGLIHYHDMDYSPTMPMSNCGLVNLEDMFENEFMLNSTKIETPKSLRTACNLASQIALHVSSQQYGGQTMSWSHIAKYVDVSRQKIKSEVLEEMEDVIVSEEKINSIIDNRLKKEIKDSVQTFQYQLITLQGTNGQSPFISMVMDFNECVNEQHEKDLALIIEEVFKQRIEGVKNENNVYRPILFPKLLYVLDEGFNVNENDKYYYLTELAIKCVTKTMQPDFISAKKSRELKDGQIIPCMGAVRGDELVSIKVNGEEFNNIKMEDAFSLIRKNNKIKHGSKNELSNFKDKCGVYKITHIPSGKYYVGSAKDIRRRLTEHRYSTRHYGKLGELYFINDFDLNNFKYEILEECHIDNLWITESKYIDLDDDNCVNHKDSKNNGNFNSENRLIALKGESYSTYKNKAYTWWEDVKNVYVKSRGEWEIVEKISYNDIDSHLKLYEVVFDKNGKYQTLHITEDHPLHTNRGRVIACELNIGDKIYDSVTYEEYEIVSVKETEEKCKTYDFTTSNDMFDLSGIISHNCRSFLTPRQDKKKYGRFNQGVVTINLPYVALESKSKGIDFWELLDERLELCHKALLTRHESLKGTRAEVAPMLWQWGAYLRLKPNEVIDPYLIGDYSTISLGYAGIYETVMALIGKSHTTDEGKELALKILDFMNSKCDEWKAKENIPYSIYGTPIEATTEKFANAIKRDFGSIEEISNHNYITNSYHVNVREKIDAFTKIGFESVFLEKSKGGAVSYVEVNPSIAKNPKALSSLIRYFYDTILYAEINTKLDYCYNCGYEGELVLDNSKQNKLMFHCPQCNCYDQTKLSAIRRLCGYIGEEAHGIGEDSPNSNQGRLGDTKDRQVHL